MATHVRPLLQSLLRLSLIFSPLPVVAHADQWTVPTPEELSMTSQPQVPGASAVYLFREELTEDNMHNYSVYVRLKVLNDGGKKFGDIELKYAAGGPAGFNIEDVVGRTIHSDGTIIPFTGKPYQKLVQKGQGYKYMAKVFSMPDVQVGSIIEYRYKLRYSDRFFVPPQWYVQSDLFTRKAHYVWKPNNRDLLITNERGQLIGSIRWANILPVGAKVIETNLPPVNLQPSQTTLDLAVHDIPPSPDEEYMPPIGSFTYRVLFYYTPYNSQEEFWQKEAKFWAKDQDRFIGPGSAVTNAVKDLTLPTDTPDQKLRKIYAAVEAMDNTRFSRSHSGSEDKSLGLREIKSTDDILLRKRGSDDQITDLFIAMARAAGFKAYPMAVVSRDRAVFFPSYLSLSQLDDLIAIVNIDGKEAFFDPGSRFCPFGHLDWRHDLTAGIRESDGGGAGIASTTGDSYKDSSTLRVANLTLNRQGVATGTVKITYIGAPALHWRQASLEGDDESLRRDLRSMAENLLPRGLEITVDHLDNVAEYEKPLTVTFNVTGELGTSTGKRFLLPGNVFEANSRTTFPHEKREVGVYFQYGHYMQDAVRINFPKEFAVESVPIAAKLQFKNFAIYSLASESTPTSVTIRRNYTLGNILYMPTEYPELRTFFSGMEARDQQNVILKIQTPGSENASTATN